MHPIRSYGYISVLRENYRKKPELDHISLNILEQFAWEKCLSAYGIHKKLNSSSDRYYRKMAYKNLNKRVHELFSLGLIERTSHGKIVNYHNAEYYRLTEYGVYRLFLNRLSSIVVNQFNLRKSQEISINMLTFFNNYQNSTLFKLFIFPYFEKQTLIAIWNYLFFDLYCYLGESCHRIQPKLEHGIIPISETMFSLEKDSEQNDYKSLSLYLKDKFNVEDISPPEKNAGNAIITIRATHTQIEIDKNKKEVKIISTANGRYEEFKYGLYPQGTKILAMEKRASEEFLEDISNSARCEMEEIIYNLVYTLENKDPQRSSEFSYYGKVLSADKKFMGAVERIYNDKHKGFEHGYKILKKNT